MKAVRRFLRVFSIAVLAAVFGAIITGCGPEDGQSEMRIFCSPDATPSEKFAAKEIRRYIYVRTGELLPIVEGSAGASAGGDRIIVATRDAPLVAAAAKSKDDLSTKLNSLDKSEYLLKSIDADAGRTVLIAGGDPIGVLYGAYRFIEHFGVRFNLDGDIIPDDPIAMTLPELDENGSPLFALRGVNTWGTHPQGFDLWTADDYKAVFSQLAKMRMNFLGIHCYPEDHPYAEPTVWIGMEDDFDDAGEVSFSYPSVYFNTGWPANWGPYPPKNTSQYNLGASILFDVEHWGSEAMAGLTPRPDAPEDCNLLFNRTGELLGDAFNFAHILGIKTCVGTESPLTIPKRVAERVKAKGKDPADPTVVRQTYEAMFKRIMNTYEIDYYWLWTNEGWVWESNTGDQFQAVVDDMKLAYEAMKNVKAPFGMATAGWVVGPQGDRAGFDSQLPTDVAISAISQMVGHRSVDPAFGNVKGRDTWAIPWMEDDLNLSSPQLWVGRTRRDAADALAYGCSGLMGLQWRTRICAPNVAALAQAGWDQSPWNPAPGKLPDKDALIVPTPLVTEGDIFINPLGGSIAAYAGSEVKGTEDDPLYQTCRYDTKGYDIKVPSGKYKVTLSFCEPHFAAADRRVFDVKLAGNKVIEKLDIFKEAGQFKALDYTFDNIEVSEETLLIRLDYIKSLPCISAIAIEGKDFSQKINCGGQNYKDYLTDSAPVTPIAWEGPRGAFSSDDFYDDWAPAMFGSAVAKETAELFKRIDGRIPRAAIGGCPSGLREDRRSWDKVKPEYAFVDELDALQSKVQGKGNRERFDYWLNTLRYQRLLAKIQCDLGAFNVIMDKINNETGTDKQKVMAGEQAMPAYEQLIKSYQQAYEVLLSTVSTKGGLATVITFEQSKTFWYRAIEVPTGQLAKVLGREMPLDAVFGKTYNGRPKIIIPTVRTSLEKGEGLRLKVIVLDTETAKDVTVNYRPMGSDNEYTTARLNHVARGVFELTLGDIDDDIEYHIKAELVDGKTLVYPVAAPELNQTVVVMP